LKELPGLTYAIQAITTDIPAIVTTTTTHGLSAGNVVILKGIVPVNHPLNGKVVRVGSTPAPTTNTFAIQYGDNDLRITTLSSWTNIDTRTMTQPIL
jgi:hypothetical protein